jgi:tetratricopeptide (TPR) repeat protein
MSERYSFYGEESLFWGVGFESQLARAIFAALVFASSMAWGMAGSSSANLKTDCENALGERANDTDLEAVGKESNELLAGLLLNRQDVPSLARLLQLANQHPRLGVIQYNLAKYYSEGGDFNQALIHQLAAQAIQPTIPGYINLADLYVRVDRYAEALAVLQKGEESESTQGRRHLLRAKQIETAFAQQDYARVIDLSADLLEGALRNSCMKQRFKALIELGRYKSAAQTFAEMPEKIQNNLYFTGWHARLVLGLDGPENAILSLAEGTGPLNDELRRNLNVILGELEKAGSSVFLGAVDEMILRRRLAGYLLELKANYLRAIGDESGASLAMEERNRLRLRAGVKERLRLAAQAKDEKRFSVALDYVNEALELEPRNYPAEILQVELLIRVNRLDLALKVINRLCEDHPSNGYLHGRRAKILWETGAWSESLRGCKGPRIHEDK